MVMFEEYLARGVPNRYTAVTYRSNIAGLLKNPDEFLVLARQDPVAAEKEMVLVLAEHRGKVANSTLRTKVACVKSFLDYERVNLNWRWIKKTTPPARMIASDRAPTIDEIRRLLDVCDLRLKAIVLIMVSCGLRVGAFWYLDIRDYSRLDNGCGRLLVYRGEAEQYFTFISSETVAALEAYLGERQRAGETLIRTSPLFRESFDYDRWGRDKLNVKRVSVHSLEETLFDRWVQIGVKHPGEGRGEFKTCHGFRKYFDTHASRGLRRDDVEYLMGHLRNYYRPDEPYLAKEYVKAVPYLTISEAEEVKREAEKDKVEMRAEIKQIRADLDGFRSILGGAITRKGVVNLLTDPDRNEDT